MSIDDLLHAMLRQAIAAHPARLARTEPTISDADRHGSEGAYRAYLWCIALTLGASRPTGHEAAEDTTAWRGVYDALDAVLSQAAADDEPDIDAAQRALRAAIKTQPSAAHRPAPRPMSMQERILGALTDLAHRAGWQISIQPQYANTGRVYITAPGEFGVRLELSYLFATDYCTLHFQGPAIEALQLRDCPPEYRYERSTLSYHMLRYADGDQIDARLRLIATALEPGTPQP